MSEWSNKGKKDKAYKYTITQCVRTRMPLNIDRLASKQIKFSKYIDVDVFATNLHKINVNVVSMVITYTCKL